MKKSNLRWLISGGIFIWALFSFGCGGRFLGIDLGDSGVKGSGTITSSNTGGIGQGYTGYDGTTGSGIIYTFVGWDANSTAGVYPTSMSMSCTATLDPTLAATVAGSYTGGTSPAGETSFGARGEGLGGLSILNTGTADSSCSTDGGTTNGFFSGIQVGALNTTTSTGTLRVFFEAAQVTDQTREHGLRLQYDCGSGFTDLGGGTEYLTSTAGASTAYLQFGPTNLPVACENNANVLLRWRYYYISGTGSRTRISLRNIRVSTDSTAPTFTGAVTATATGTDTINLSWPAATDNVSTANYMRYDIYRSLTSGGQNFTAAPTLTVRGTTSAQITGLAQGTQYFFVVRARDEQGNRTAAAEVNTTTSGTACTTVEGLRDQITGTNVAVSCTITDAYVTYVFSNGFTFQKTQGGAALFVFTSTAPTVAVGNRITITGIQGTLFSGLRQLTASPGGHNISANDNGAYDVLTNLATTINDGDTLDANNESKLVRTTQTGNVTALGANENTFRLNGGATDYSIRSGTGTPDMQCTGRTFTITRGVVDRFNTLFRFKSNTADVNITNLCSFNITAAASTGNTTATVTFSHTPNTTPAQTSGNYEIVLAASACGSGAVIAVSGASLSGSVVTLTTAAQTGGTSYKVCVTNVTRSADTATLTTNNSNFTGTAGGGGTTIYNFTNWTASATAGTYPSNMTFGCTQTLDPTLAATIGGNYSGATNLAGTSFGVNGQGTGGISFVNTGTANAICNYGAGNGFMASFDINISTVGRTNIQVSWSAAQIADQGREHGLRLQYDCTGGGFTDAAGPVEFLTASVGASLAYSNFGPTTLPAACENNATVRIRWRYYFISGTGSRTRIALDEILVTGT